MTTKKDVTEEKFSRDEGALKARQDDARLRFERYLALASDSFWETDAEHKLIGGSPTMLELMEEANVMLRGQSLFQDMDKKLAKSPDWETLQAAMDRHEPFQDVDVRFQIGEGMTLWWSSSGVPHFDDNDNFMGYVGTLREVTEERAASRQHLLQTQVMQGMTEGVFLIGADATILDVNSSAERIIRRPREELIGHKSISEIWPAAGIDYTVVTRGLEVLAEEGIWQEEVLLHPGDDEIWVDVRLFGVPTEDNQSPYTDRILIARDITEEKTAKEKLEANKARLEQAQGIARLGHWEWDMKTDVVTASAEFRRLYGFDDGTTLTGEALMDRVRPDDRSILLDGMNDPGRPAKDTWGHQYRVEQSSGVYIWLEAHANFLLDADGNCTGIIGTVLDVNEQHETEARLRESEVRFRSVMENSLDSILHLRAMRDDDNNIVDFVYIDANEAEANLSGRTREELVGHTVTSLFPIVLENGLLELYADFVTSSKAVEREAQATQNEVRAEWMRILAVPNGDDLASHIQDITARHIAEENLRLSEERLNDIVSATSDLLWETDADHRLTVRSDRYKEITGVDPSKHMGVRPWENPSLQGKEEDWTDYKAAMESQKPFRNIRNKMTFPDGRAHYFSTSGIPFHDQEGNFLGFRGSATEITQQVLAEERLLESEQRLANILSATSGISG